MLRSLDVTTAGQIVTLVKPVGNEIPLRIGEIIEGQVVDFFPSGGLTIKVKGGFLPARTDLNFQKNENIFLRVVGQNGKNGELTLQLLPAKSQISLDQGGNPVYPGTEQGTIEELTQQLANMVDGQANKGIGSEKIGEAGAKAFPVDAEKMRNLVEGLLKALPSQVGSLPKELRSQIQQVLKDYITGQPGQEVQKNLTQCLSHLSELMSSPITTQGLKDKLMVSMEGLLSGQLKTALENSGVLMEAKLKVLGESDPTKESFFYGNNNKIGHDLKALLIQLKNFLENPKGAESSSGAFLKSLSLGKTGTSVSEQKVLGEVDNLLKDVETFQLLSKISDSFWTFLPVQWSELKKGDLVFKRRKGQDGYPSYSCGIHLDLGATGLVSVFIVNQFRDFFVTFKVENSDLSTLIESHWDELKKNFLQAGLRLRNISLFDGAENLSDPFDHVDSGETIVSIRI